MATTVDKNDGHIRIVSVEVSNTASSCTVRLDLYAVTAVFRVSGTLRVGGGTQSFEDYGPWNPGSRITYLSKTVSYGSDSSNTLTIQFSGRYSFYEDEEDEVTNNVTLTGYHTSYKPVTAAISTSSNSVNLGSAVTITTSGGSNGALTWKIGSETGTIATVGNTSTSWTPALATFAQKITTSSSATCILGWNGVTKNITLNVPNNANTKPSCTLTMAPDNGSLGFVNTYIQNVSQAVATVTSSAQYGATIRTTSISLNDSTYSSSPATSGILSSSGSKTCSVTVTDSRGFTKTVSATYTVTAYSDPAISNINIYRSNSSGTATDNGTYLTYKFNNAITQITQSSPSATNAKQYKLAYKQSTSSSWTYYPASGWNNLNAYSGQNTITVGGGALSTTSLYDVKIFIRDSFKEVSSNDGGISTEAVMMDFNSAGTGGGIGMYTQAPDYLDVAWKVRARGGVNIPFTGTGVTSTTYLAVFDSNKNIVPMNKDYISGGGGGSNVTVTKFNQSNTKSSVGTSYVYSGVSVTIPANSYYMFRFAAWKESSVNPSGIVLASSSTSLTANTSQQEKLAGTSGYQVEDVYCDYTDSSSVTWYLWIKAASSTTLGFRIKGWYMQVSS